MKLQNFTDADWEGSSNRKITLGVIFSVGPQLFLGTIGSRGL